MSALRAFSLAGYHHVVGTDGRISGNWLVLLPVSADRSDCWVTPIDVTIWDEWRYGGRVIHSDAFTARVTTTEVKLGRVKPSVEPDVAEVADLLATLLSLVVEVARRGEGSVVDEAKEAA